MNLPKLLIAIPCRGDVRGSALKGILRCVAESISFWKKTHGIEAEVFPAVHFGAHAALARTQIAMGALRDGFDWILWMDDDALPRHDLLERLWAHSKEFICPVFFKKDPPFELCVYDMVEAEEKFDHRPIEMMPPRLQRVDACGFHSVLMHRVVLERVVEVTKGKPFVHLPGLSEDIYFCVAAKRAGIQLWCDTSIDVPHIRDIAINAEHHLMAKQEKENQCASPIVVPGSPNRRIASLWPKPTGA